MPDLTPSTATPATTTETTATPNTVTTTTAVKSGWLTSEHALSAVAMLLTALYTTNAIPTDGMWAKLAAVLAFVLISLGYTVSRTMVKKAAMLIVVIFAFGVGPQLVGCGASQRETTIKTALVATDAAESAFVAFDARHQDAIVSTATSLEDGKAKLAAYREQRAKVLEAFGAAYRAIAAAAVLSDDPKSMTSLALAAGILADGLRSMGVSIP